MKKLISIALIALLAMTFVFANAGTEAASGNGEVKYAEHLTFADSMQVAQLNPYGLDNEATGRTFNMVYNQLVTLNADGTLAPELATSWTWSDDLKSVTFKLRDDVYFSNGEKLKAEDVAFSLGEAPAKYGTSPIYVGDLDHFEVIDDLTVKACLKVVNTEWVYYCAGQNASIICKKACDADPEKGPSIGTGAFVFDLDKWIPGDTIEFVRNDNFWGEAPKTKYWTFKYVGNGSSRLINLENNDVQITYNLLRNEIESAQSNKQLVVTPYKGTGTRYIAFNTKEGPCTDINLRKAIAYCVNRDAIIKACGDTDAQGTYTLFCWAVNGYTPDVEPHYEYDLEKAKEYLAKASTKTVEFMVNTSSADYKAILEVVQEDARKIGLTITVREVDSAGLSANSKYASAIHEALIYGISLNLYSSDVNRLLAADKNSNKSIVHDEHIDELVAAATATTDAAEAAKIWAELQSYVNEQCYYVPVYYASNTLAWRQGVEGIVINGLSRHDFSQAYMIVK